ncbi:MAG TPA: patatin-like phospholipase family protein [Acidimicrobiales bacterium]|nr:patatin-like phospholipase family protein [Acidimicrobiales bacterium]
MKTGLVLGGGGIVGMAYHAGVLRALEAEAGFRPADADLVVGTSAGSVVGAYLRTGWSTEDFWQLALGTHPTKPGIGGEVDGKPVGSELMTATWRTPFDLSRRALGSAYVLGRSLSPFRLPMAVPVPEVLTRLFPGGLFEMTEGRRRFEEELPEEWPEAALWLTTVDISTGRRVVLGRTGAPTASLRKAVMASAAIPGFYRPVKVGKRVLVDGGAHSSSNLDLAVRARCSLIIGVVPLAFDTVLAPAALMQLVRRWPARSLAAEVALAKRRNVEVLLLRPTADEVRLHGLNLMRPDGLDRIARAAYDATARTLATDRFRSVLADLPAA